MFDGWREGGEGRERWGGEKKEKEQKEKKKGTKRKKKGFYVFSIKMNVDLIEGYNFKWPKVQGR